MRNRTAQLVRACGDDTMADFFSKAVDEPAWLGDWIGRLSKDLNEGYDTYELESEAGLRGGNLNALVRWLAGIGSENADADADADAERRCYRSMRAALELKGHLVSLDWKFGREDALFNLDELFAVHDLPATSDGERDAITETSMPELLTPMGRLADSRGRTLLQLDDGSDSYQLLLAEPEDAAPLIGIELMNGVWIPKT